MKKFMITEERINLLIRAFEELGLVEVKGESVQHLYSARMTIKQSVESLKEIKELINENEINKEKEE